MTTTTSTGLLPVRIPMRPDEWTETYLVALARAQGLRRPRANDVERLRTVLLRQQSSAVARPPLDAASSLDTPAEAPNGEESLPSWAVIARSAPLRYCPSCLIESRYFRSRWRLAGFHACTVHGCRLKSDLFEEAITTYMARRNRTSVVDADAARLLGGAVCCSADELRAIKMVWAPLETAAQTASTPEERHRAATLAGWSALLWSALDVVAFAHYQQILHQPTNGELARVSRFVKDFEVAAQPSMEGLLSLFSSFTENAHFRAAKRLIDALEARDVREGTALMAVPLRHLGERLAALAPEALIPRPVGGTALQGVRDHSICKAAFIDQLAAHGPRYQAVNRLFQRGQIPTTKLPCGSREFTLIEKSHAQRARRLMLSLIHANEFMVQHDIDTTTYEAIRHAALLKTGILRAYLYRQEITALVTRLELMCSPATDIQSPRWQVFCAATIGAVGGRPMFSDFIQAALQGRFQMFRDLSKQGLSAFSISADALSWAVERRRAIHCARAVQPTQGQGRLFCTHESEVIA